METYELVTAHAINDATITVRVIKSFEYRTIKNHIFRHIDLSTTTVGQLLHEVQLAVNANSGFRPYRTVHFDTLKIYTHAHLTKTMNLAINLDHEDWILSDPNKTLAECGIMNESEISCFNRDMYDKYLENPDGKWD